MRHRHRWIQLASVIVLGLVGIMSASGDTEAAERYCDFWFWTCPINIEAFCWHRSCEPLNPYCTGGSGDWHVVCQGFE